MPSVTIHLAIAKRYIEKGGAVTDSTMFYNGSVMPDLSLDKKSTHYGLRGENENNLVLRMQQKVDLRMFLSENTLDNDLNLGRFLHLYADQEYYNQMPNEYLLNTSLADFLNDAAFTLSFHDEHIRRKYKIDFNETTMSKEIDEEFARWRKPDPSSKLLLTKAEMDDYIERMSSVNILELAKAVE